MVEQVKRIIKGGEMSKRKQINGTKFKPTFTMKIGIDWYVKGDVIKNITGTKKIVVLTHPREHNNKWYHRILRKIIPNVFRPYYSYKCENIDSDILKID